MTIWVFTLFFGIINVIKDYRNEAQLFYNSQVIAVSVIVVYVVLTTMLAFITFARRLPYELRAAVLLFICYTLGAVGLSLSSFSGDGRIFLFAFVTLSAVLLDLRYSLISLVASYITFVAVGWLQIQGFVLVPPDRQINSTDLGAWLSGGLVFLVLSIASYLAINYILRTLQGSLDESRASLLREQHLSRILRTVSDINQLIVREQDQAKLLSDACEHLIAGLGYAFAWVGLLEADRVTLKLVASAGGSIDPSKFTINLARQDAGLSCAKMAIQTRKYFHIDASSGMELCKDCPYREIFPNHSSVALPLLRDEHVFGVLVADHPLLSSDIFDQSEIQLLQELANNLAFALEKLETDRQLQILNRRATLVNEITLSALETPDLDSMLQTLAERLREIFFASACYIVLFDKHTQTLRPVAATGDLKEVFRNASLEQDEYDMAIAMLKAGQALVVDDVGLDARISPRITQAFSIKSLLGLPLTADGTRQGAVFLTFKEMHCFTSDEIALGEQAVGHAALALSKAILYQDARAKANELGRLYAAAQDMASSLLDTDALLLALLRHMTDALDATSGYISAVNLSTGAQRILAEYWSDFAGDAERKPNLGDIYALDDYLFFRRALAEGKVVVMHADDEGLTAAERQQFADYGVFTIMFVPVMAQGEIQGGIEIWESRAKRKFTPDETNLVLGMAGHAASIIQNAQLFDSLRISEGRFRTLIEQASDGIFIADAQRRFVDVNLSACLMLGYTREELLSMNIADLAARDLSEFREQMQELRTGKTLMIETQLKRKDGSLVSVEISSKLLPNGYLQGIARDITERKRAEQALQESQSRLTAIITTALNGIITINSEQEIVLFNPSAETIFGYPSGEVLGQKLERLIPLRYRGSHFGYIQHFADTNFSRRQKGLLDTLVGLRANGEEFPMEAFISQSEIAGQKFFTVILQDITRRRQAEEALRTSEEKFRSLAENIPSVVYQCRNDERYTFLYLNEAIEELTGYPSKTFTEQGLSFFDLYHPDDLPVIQQAEGPSARSSKGPFHETYRIRHKSGEWRWVDEWGTVVVDAHDNVQYLEGVMIDITERKRAEHDLRRRADELEILAEASSALRLAPNVKEVFSIVTQRAVQILRGTYGSLFLLEVESGTLVSRGWYSARPNEAGGNASQADVRCRLGEGISGQVALSGKIHITSDLRQDPLALVQASNDERLRNVFCGIAAPLHAQNGVIGVLHVWMEEEHTFDESDIRLLTALADMAGNAIQRGLLHEQALSHADELSLAYDKTLAGWARALELRDEQTEGHTRRVTELTLRLAPMLGVTASELVQIGRGALLHDIGKMGIPDAILHKPGPLTPQEKSIMDRHPGLAYDMLKLIPFLRPAMDIPYCHHEHWDGTGYPRGLAGSAIPLAARIFSVVDVWDALTSDRPYRKAWSREKTAGYLREYSGKYFDPQVVDLFLTRVIDDNEMRQQ